jgi:hypothetical protein
MKKVSRDDMIRRGSDERSSSNHMIMKRCDEQFLAITWLGEEVTEQSFSRSYSSPLLLTTKLLKMNKNGLTLSLLASVLECLMLSAG